LKVYRNQVYSTQSVARSKASVRTNTGLKSKDEKESNLTANRKKKDFNDEDEMENPVESDAVKKIISFLK